MIAKLLSPAERDAYASSSNIGGIDSDVLSSSQNKHFNKLKTKVEKKQKKKPAAFKVGVVEEAASCYNELINKYEDKTSELIKAESRIGKQDEELKKTATILENRDTEIFELRKVKQDFEDAKALINEYDEKAVLFKKQNDESKLVTETKIQELNNLKLEKIEFSNRELNKKLKYSENLLKVTASDHKKLMEEKSSEIDKLNSQKQEIFIELRKVKERLLNEKESSELVKNLQIIIDEKSEKVSSLRDENKQLHAKIKKLGIQIKNVGCSEVNIVDNQRQKISELENKLSNTTMLYESTNQNVDNVVNENKSLLEEINKLNLHIADLKETSEKRVNDLKTIVNLKSECVASLNDENKQLKSTVENMDIQIKNHGYLERNNKENDHQCVKELNDKLFNTAKLYESPNPNLDDVVNENKSLLEQINKLNLHIADLKDSSEQRVKDLKTIVNVKSECVTSLNDENKQLNAAIKNTNIENSEVNSVENHHQNIKDLKDKLFNAEKLYESTNQHLDTVVDENKNLIKKTNLLDVHIAKMVDEKKQMTYEQTQLYKQKITQQEAKEGNENLRKSIVRLTDAIEKSYHFGMEKINGKNINIKQNQFNDEEIKLPQDESQILQSLTMHRKREMIGYNDYEDTANRKYEIQKLKDAFSETLREICIGSKVRKKILSDIKDCRLNPQQLLNNSLNNIQSNVLDKNMIQEQLNEFKEHNIRLIEERGEQKHIIQNYENVIEELKKSDKDLKKCNKNQEKYLKKLQIELNESISNVNKSDCDNKNLRDKLQNLEKKMQQLHITAMDFAEEHKSMHYLKSKMQSRIDVLSKQLNYYKGIIDVFKSTERNRCQGFICENQALKDQNSKLSEKISQCVNSIAQYQKIEKELIVCKETLRMHKQHQNEKIYDQPVQAEPMLSSSPIINLQVHLDKNNLLQDKGISQNVENEVEMLKNEIQSLKSKQSENAEKTSLENEIKTYSQKVLTLTMANTEFEGINNSLKEKLITLGSEITLLKDEISKNEIELLDAKNTLLSTKTEYENKCLVMEEEKEKCFVEIKQKQEESECQHNKEIKMELEKVKNKVIELQTEKQKNGDLIMRLKEEKSELKMNVNRAEREILNLKENLKFSETNRNERRNAEFFPIANVSQKPKKSKSDGVPIWLGNPNINETEEIIQHQNDKKKEQIVFKKEKKAAKKSKPIWLMSDVSDSDESIIDDSIKNSIEKPSWLVDKKMSNERKTINKKILHEDDFSDQASHISNRKIVQSEEDEDEDLPGNRSRRKCQHFQRNSSTQQCDRQQKSENIKRKEVEFDSDEDFLNLRPIKAAPKKIIKKRGVFDMSQIAAEPEPAKPQPRKGVSPSKKLLDDLREFEAKGGYNNMQQKRPATVSAIGRNRNIPNGPSRKPQGGDVDYKENIPISLSDAEDEFIRRTLAF